MTVLISEMLGCLLKVTPLLWVEEAEWKSKWFPHTYSPLEAYKPLISDSPQGDISLLENGVHREAQPMS